MSLLAFCTRQALGGHSCAGSEQLCRRKCRDEVLGHLAEVAMPQGVRNRGFSAHIMKPQIGALKWHIVTTGHSSV